MGALTHEYDDWYAERLLKDIRASGYVSARNRLRAFHDPTQFV